MIYVHKNTAYYIPQYLIRKQKVSKADLDVIVKLQKERQDLTDYLRLVYDVVLIKIIANQIEQINYDLQILWGFPTDRSHHKSYNLPHCTCPTADNADILGSGLVWVNYTCPIHN